MRNAEEERQAGSPLHSEPRRAGGTRAGSANTEPGKGFSAFPPSSALYRLKLLYYFQAWKNKSGVGVGWHDSHAASRPLEREPRLSI